MPKIANAPRGLGYSTVARRVAAYNRRFGTSLSATEVQRAAIRAAQGGEPLRATYAAIVYGADPRAQTYQSAEQSAEFGAALAIQFQWLRASSGYVNGLLDGMQAGAYIYDKTVYYPQFGGGYMTADVYTGNPGVNGEYVRDLPGGAIKLTPEYVERRISKWAERTAKQRRRSPFNYYTWE